MTVQLVPMSEEAFSTFLDYSIKEYAKEHTKAGNWLAEEAMDNAIKEFNYLLPDGLATKDHTLFTVFHDEQPIGILWINVPETSKEKRAFIYDVELEETYRGKGLGKATMEALDEYARSQNITDIRLHVFAHNQRALALYEKMGYKITDYSMKKLL